MAHEPPQILRFPFLFAQRHPTLCSSTIRKRRKSPKNATILQISACCRADLGCSHLVRVGVSWKTAESRRASGLIAEELHRKTSRALGIPPPPLYQISPTEGAKKRSRNCDNRRFAWARCQPPPRERDKQQRAESKVSGRQAAISKCGFRVEREKKSR